MTPMHPSLPSGALPNWLAVAIAALAIGGVFFVAEHTLSISTVPGFVAEIDQQESWSAGGDTLRRAAFIGLALLGAAAVATNNGSFKTDLPPTIWGAVMLLLWAGASISWSIDPATSVRRYLLLLCSVIGAMGLARLLDIRQIVLSAAVVFSVYLCLGVLVEVSLGTFRPWTADYRFAGTVHPNTQGAFLAILCLALATLALAAPQRRLIYVLLFSVVFLFLLLTRSRTACAALLVALLTMAMTAISSKRRAYATLATVWLLAIAALAVTASGFDPAKEYASVLLMGRQEQSGSLTGRIPLWEDLWIYIRQRPLLGYGYEAFWTPRHIYDVSMSQEWTISEAHSTYFSTWLQLGIVGLGLLVATALFGVLRVAACYRASTNRLYLFLVGGIVFCLLRGVTEAGMETPTAVTMVLGVGVLRSSSAGKLPEISRSPLASRRALSVAEL